MRVAAIVVCSFLQGCLVLKGCDGIRAARACSGADVCGGGMLCDAGFCQRPECVGDADCGSGRHCSEHYRCASGAGSVVITDVRGNGTAVSAHEAGRPLIADGIVVRGEGLDQATSVSLVDETAGRVWDLVIRRAEAAELEAVMPVALDGIVNAAGLQATVRVSAQSGTAAAGVFLLRGDAGPQGIAGPSGVDGARGPTGAPGENGSPGLPGQMGMPGTDGAPGVTGAAGPTGARGPTGNAGPSGPTGIGSVGPTGPSGPALQCNTRAMSIDWTAPNNAISCAPVESNGSSHQLLVRGFSVAQDAHSGTSVQAPTGWKASIMSTAGDGSVALFGYNAGNGNAVQARSNTANAIYAYSQNSDSIWGMSDTASKAGVVGEANANSAWGVHGFTQSAYTGTIGVKGTAFTNGVGVQAVATGSAIALEVQGPAQLPFLSIVTGSGSVGSSAGAGGVAAATCPANSVLIFGGCQSSSGDSYLVSSYSSDASTWTCEYRHIPVATTGASITAYARCLRNAP